MTLSAGVCLGPYEVEALLGAGGMGEVYRARDKRLDRTVAVKVLPASFAADPARRARFEREARAISSLNHPHICTLHDVGQQDGVDFLVMEYVEGESLAACLRRGPLPLDDVLRHGSEMARALSRAHRQGVVHRDLKPANVMLTKSGVKLLDFGLAKLAAAKPEGTDALSAQATADQPLTGEGTHLGTLPYMAPEQLEGKEAADNRADIWSLGAVLYEMATGTRAFVGTSQASLTAAILAREPPSLTSLQPVAPPALERAVRACLAKDPDERWQDAGDLARELQWIREAPKDVAPPRTSDRNRRLARVALALAASTAAASLIAWALIARGLLRLGPPIPVPRFVAVTFRTGIVSSARFAPDGQGIVYSASWEGAPYELFLTRQGGTEARPLGLTQVRILAVSGQGEMALLRGDQNVHRGFGVLARAPLSGGAPRDLSEHVAEADWTPDGSELAALGRVAGRRQVEFPLGHKVYEAPALFSLRVSPDGTRVAFFDRSAAGYEVVVMDRSGKKTTLSQDWLPGGIGGLDWSPRGDEVVFAATRGSYAPALYAVSLAGRERPLVMAPKHLILQDVFADGRALVTTGVGRGGMACLPPGQSAERELGWLDFPDLADISADGATVLFSELRGGGGASGSIYLRRTDGSPAVRLGDGHARALSDDGKWVLAYRPDNPSQWALLPTGPGIARSLPGLPGVRLISGRWLPDGKRIVFSGARGTTVQTYVQDVDSGAIRPITPEPVVLHSVTPDGRFVVGAAAGTARLYPVDGGAAQAISWLGSGDIVGWNADGSAAFVARGGSGPRVEIQRVEVGTGQAQRWKTLTPASPVGIERLSGVVVARDGRSYCYSYERVLHDLYVVEGLDLAPRRTP